ncbi:MAG TPA: tetratricopeptide repeat protein [Sedimenticola sp.]|nr:tetratricopeptide repeat protein [Sedimenticola sp.]
MIAAAAGAASRTNMLLAVAALLVLTFSAYHEAPANGYHLDDFHNIVQHAPIWLDKLTLSGLINAGREAFSPTRPLPSITFALDWWRGGGDPAAFQWTNMGIHAAAALMVFALLTLMLRQFLGRLSNHGLWCAFLGAAFWAVHPIQIQGVTYIVQRMASMAAFFTLLSVWSYAQGRLASKGNAFWFILCGLAALCGALSKENAWVTPLLLLLAEYGLCRHNKPLIRGRLDYFWLSLPPLLGMLVVADLASGAGPLSRYALPGFAFRDFTLAERLLTQPRVVLFHISQILWPLPERFSIEHSFSISTGLFRPFSTFIAIAAVFLWTGAGVRLLLKQNARLWGFCMLWVPATLAIESTAIPLEIIFEHRMYLPLAGLAGLLSLCLAAAARRGRTFARVTGGLAALFVIACLASTLQRVPDWRNRLSLYESALRNAPDSARTLGTLAMAYVEEGRLALAASMARRALQLDPDEPYSLETLGITLMDRGRLDEAGQYFSRSFAQAGARASLMNHWGELMVKKGRYREALKMFRHSVKRMPWVSTYHWNIAVTYEHLNECLKARAHWDRFLQLEKNEKDRQAVREHLAEEYDAPGGKCSPRQK